jgi:hypothetical protein
MIVYEHGVLHLRVDPHDPLGVEHDVVDELIERYDQSLIDIILSYIRCIYLSSSILCDK